MEPDKLEQYIVLKDQCQTSRLKSIFTVKEMTAFDLELSEEARSVKIRWFEKILERLLKLQSRSVWPSIRQCAVSNFTPSTFLLSKGPCCTAAPAVSPKPPQAHLYQCQLHRRKNNTLQGNFSCLRQMFRKC